MSGELTRVGEGLFRVVRRGYDRAEVDDYVAQLQRRIVELQEQGSPDGAVRAALTQVGEDVSAVLQQSHATATQVISAARQESAATLSSARAQAAEMIADAERQAAETIAAAQDEGAEQRRAAVEYATDLVSSAERRVRELDVDTDRIWAERERIVADTRDLARQLQGVAEIAAERFPSDGEPSATGESSRPTR